ncbi:MAG: hypothetical protein IJI22_02035 [Bacilli bacterium]|nr:hypothetical protein [Bacilli bacterium]
MYKRNSGHIIFPMILIFMSLCLIFVGLYFSFFKGSKKENKNENNNVDKVAKSSTGFYVIDYDYNGLIDGGDGSEMHLSHGYLGEFYGISEMPSAYFDDEKITSADIMNNTFSEPNSRFLVPFVDSVDDYYIYNIDNSSTVEEAYAKGWYSIENLSISNLSVEYDHLDPYATFDAIIKGLGRPYCVIRSKSNDIENGYEFNNIFIIYKYDNGFYLLDYYDNSNGEKEVIDLLSSYWIASEDMLKASIADNVGSNNIDSYTQSYIFQNGKDLIS